jgi:membrane associated rhomboid family serine protease
MEERYGSVIIGIMIFVSALFAGVLNACFCETSLVGAVPLVSMMIFLNAFMSFSKKKFPLSFAAVMVLFVLLQIFSGAGAVKIIICIAGGLCGSLFAFLTSPKMKAEKKASKGAGGSGGGLLNRAEKVAYAEELDRNSPRNKKSYDDDDESTVVGTLKF